MDFRSLWPHDVTGLHYAVRIFAGTTAVWLAFRALGDLDPVWAVVSLIIVTEPQTVLAWQAFRGRIANTIIGCVAALFFLVVAGPEPLILPLAVMATVLIYTYVVRVPQSWRTGPVTAALVLAAGVAANSRETGLEVAGRRAAEVFLGSIAAVTITWLASLLWPVSAAEPVCVAAPLPGATERTA